MNKNVLKIGEEYAVAVSRNDTSRGAYKGTLVSIDPGGGSGTDSVVTVLREDGGHSVVKTGNIKMRWSAYVADQTRIKEQDYVQELGRRALENERRELMERTRDAGYNLVEEVRFTDGGMRVSVSYDVWSKLLTQFDNGPRIP